MQSFSWFCIFLGEFYDWMWSFAEVAATFCVQLNNRNDSKVILKGICSVFMFHMRFHAEYKIVLSLLTKFFK